MCLIRFVDEQIAEINTVQYLTCKITESMKQIACVRACLRACVRACVRAADPQLNI